MTRGRKPKPPELKILTGNPGKREISQNFPKSETEIGRAPNWFSKEQKSTWNHAVKHAPRGLLTVMDRSPLIVWVVANDIHRQAGLAMLDDGLVIKSQKGLPIQNPYLSIMNRQAELMIKASAELGFSPSSRCKVTVSGNQPLPPNKFSNNGPPM